MESERGGRNRRQKEGMRRSRRDVEVNSEAVTEEEEEEELFTLAETEVAVLA